MSWIIFAILSMFSETIKSLIHRKVMISEDPYAYALFENIFAALIFLFLIKNFQLPTELIGWFILSISASLWLAISIISQFSYKYTKVSIQEPLKQTRILWVFLFGTIFLHEIFTLQKALGTLLIIIGLTYLSYSKKKKLGSFMDKGVQYTLLTAFLFAMVTIVDKKALQYFNPETYGFLVYFLPGLALLYINRKTDKKKIYSLITKFWFAIIIVALSSFGFYYFKLKALVLADATLVFPIIRSSTILVVLGGIILFKEKDQILKKVLTSIIVFIGVILLTF